MRLGKKLYLILPPVLFVFIDALITLIGQTTAYWADHAHVEEANPLSAYMLSCGPGFFIVEQLLMTLAIVLLVAYLPRQVTLLASISFVLGHAFGFLTWMLFRYGMFWFVYIYFPLIALIVIWQVLMYYKHKDKKLIGV